MSAMEYDPYHEGVEAAHSNKCRADCPYEFGTLEANLWIEGFEDGGGNE